MNLGQVVRQSVTTMAQPRIVTAAMATFDPMACLDSATATFGNVDGLIRRMTRGIFNDDGTAGGVTARASMGVEA